MIINNVTTFQKNYEYRWVTVSNNDNWADIKISIGNVKYDGTQNFDDHIVYDCNDKCTEQIIEFLIYEIRLLSLYHEFINILLHPNIHIDNSSQTLYWVYAESCSHVKKIGVKSGSAKPKDMYYGNCFYTRVEAEAYREELITIFNKYGINITRI